MSQSWHWRLRRGRAHHVRPQRGPVPPARVRVSDRDCHGRAVGRGEGQRRGDGRARAQTQLPGGRAQAGEGLECACVGGYVWVCGWVGVCVCVWVGGGVCVFVCGCVCAQTQLPGGGAQAGEGGWGRAGRVCANLGYSSHAHPLDLPSHHRHSTLAPTLTLFLAFAKQVNTT